MDCSGNKVVRDRKVLEVQCRPAIASTIKEVMGSKCTFGTVVAEI